MCMYVDVEALNFRAKPEINSENRIAILHLGQPVNVLGAARPRGWSRISADIGDGTQEGYVSNKFLRTPVAPAREALVAQAIVEWLRFKQGLGMEFDEPFSDFVGEMWQAIGYRLDGRDRDVPWSAAAISFMVRNAAEHYPEYAKFKFAAAHARYIHDSIQRRFVEDTDAPFWGYRLHERRPELGDMVCRWRQTPRNFDDASVTNAFKSHADIIVCIRPDDVLAIGGNVNHSVSITKYDKTPAGFLADSNQVFAHLANRV